MGIITRSAANNITTGGVILPAGINDASVASITGLAQVSAGDGITLISSQTASSSASLSFTTGIDSTYRTYLFKLINIHPSINTAEFGFNLSSDGGSNYNVTKTSSAFVTYHNEADNDTAVAYYGIDLAQSTNNQKISGNFANDSDSGLCSSIYLFNPSNTTYVKHFIATSNFMSGVYYESAGTYVAGYGNTTSAINAIRFQTSSGNIDAGTIHMYGIA
jgi:hypothetical protein